MALFSKQPPETGVQKLRKRGFFDCASIMLNSFSTIVKVNLLYCLFLLPLILLCGVIALIVFPDTNILNATFKFQFVYQLMLIPLPLAFSGPATAAMSKLVRNLGRGEHVFVFKDFIEVFKKCFFKATLVSVTAYVFYISAAFAFMVYWGTWVLFAVAAIATLYFTLMLNYVYIMTYSLKLSVFKMFKNAFFLILTSFRQSLKALLVIIIFAAFFVVNIILTLCVNVAVLFFAAELLLIHFALPQLFVNYYLFDVIIKQVVEPFYADKNNAGKVIGDNMCENNAANETTQSEQSDYIYENGRLIKKSVYESERIFDDEIK